MTSAISHYPAEKLLPADQLNPRLYQIDYSMRRYFVDEFYTRYVATLPAGTQVLDVGGHRDVKRGQFDITRYNVTVAYINLQADKGTDVLGDAAALPFATACKDAVICGELLEHVPDPRRVLREIYRVLKPGGWALITVPFLYRIHADPYDYGRYTDYYWQQALHATGFEGISIEKQGLFGSVAFDMLREHLYRQGWVAGKWRRWQSWIVRVVVRLRRRALRWDSHLASNPHPIYTSYTTGFGIVARRP